jgi:hypothetical protein
MLARLDAQRAARQATEAITRELAEAMYVFDVTPGSQLTILVARDQMGYRVGTATATQNSAAVTGAGTQWLGAALPGYWFRLESDGPWYVIASVDSDTRITLTTSYQETGGSGSYTIRPPDAVVRYWLALRDPEQNLGPAGGAYQGAPWGHKPYYELASGTTDRFVDPPYNPFYLARSEVEDPWKRNDPWNDTNPGFPTDLWGLCRAAFFYPPSFSYDPGGAGWSPWPESQPGDPWLEGVRLYPDRTGSSGQQAADQRKEYYRERAIAVTPTDPNYDVADLGFSPERISSESLAPRSASSPKDYSVYAARYPLWSGFGGFAWTGATTWTWSAVGGESAGSGVRIYRAGVQNPDQPVYMTRVKADDGSVWVCGRKTQNPVTFNAPGDAGTYNTRWYPLAWDQAGSSWVQRNATSHPYAFGIDYDTGTIKFAFPSDHVTATSNPAVYTLDGTVVPGSDRVTVNGTLYRRVEGLPDANEYRLDGSSLIFSAVSPPPASQMSAHYEWRNNLDTDLVSATYSTKQLITVALTVSKQDPAAHRARDARQDFRMVSRVKVRNTPEGSGG